MTAQPTKKPRGTEGRIVASAMQAKYRMNGVAMRKALESFMALPLHERLAKAKSVDPKAAIKHCKRCQRDRVCSAEMLHSEFHSDRQEPDGYAATCKACKRGFAPTIQIVPAPKRKVGRPKGVKDSKPRVTHTNTAIDESLRMEVERLQAMTGMLDGNTPSNPAPSPAAATVSAMTTTDAPNAPVTVSAPAVFSQSAPAPDDLIWVGDDAYNRRKIVQVRRLDIDGKPALSVVLDAIEHDPRTNVSKSICIDLFGNEVDEFLAQLRGDYGNLVNRLALMRAEIATWQATAERWQRAYDETLAERDKARDERDRWQAEAIEKAAKFLDTQRRLDGLVSRLAAVGIKIDLD